MKTIMTDNTIMIIVFLFLELISQFLHIEKNDINKSSKDKIPAGILMLCKFAKLPKTPTPKTM